MPELDFGDELGLQFVDAEADHQVRDDVRLVFGLPDDFNRLVDVEEDFGEALQQVEFFLLLAEVIGYPAADAGLPEADPFEQYPSGSQHPRRPVDQDVEVAGIGVFQRRQFEEPRHQLVRVGRTADVDRDFQAV